MKHCTANGWSRSRSTEGGNDRGIQQQKHTPAPAIDRCALAGATPLLALRRRSPFARLGFDSRRQQPCRPPRLSPRDRAAIGRAPTPANPKTTQHRRRTLGAGVGLARRAGLARTREPQQVDGPAVASPSPLPRPALLLRAPSTRIAPQALVARAVGPHSRRRRAWLPWPRRSWWRPPGASGPGRGERQPGQSLPKRPPQQGASRRWRAYWPVSC